MSSTAQICFITLGCAKNEVDTNRMRALIAASDLTEIDDPAQADIVIVNTCSFITEATEEAIETIFEVLALPNFDIGDARLIVTGCMPARYGEELRGELPEVAIFVSPADEERIVEICRSVLSSAEEADELSAALPMIPPEDSAAELAASQLKQSSLTNPREESSASRNHSSASSAQKSAAINQKNPQAPQRIVDAPWAYVKISDGCSRCCSYCTIPRIRGPYHSRTFEEIAAEVGELIAGGVHEVILIGQDTGIWGSDLKGSAAQQETDDIAPRTLADLLDHLATAHPAVWFRVMYLQPQGITDKLLATMARHDNICNYLDIPLQHVNEQILKEMNRSGSAQEYRELITRIRAVLPDATLRTTLIAGFPGETREQAAELKSFIEETDFDYVGIFTYSQEDGTLAGERGDQVPLRTRKARQQRLRDAADAIGFQRVAALVGTEQEVLICGTDEEGVYGRTKGQAPDVDGIVHLPVVVANPQQGIVRAHITDAICYDFYGTLM